MEPNAQDLPVAIAEERVLRAAYDYAEALDGDGGDVFVRAQELRQASQAYRNAKTWRLG